MQKAITSLEPIHLVGITARTHNNNEIDPSTAKISPTVGRYLEEQLSEKISDRLEPGTIYCAYTNYESDWMGEYTFFIGTKVSSFEHVPAGFETLTIPAQTYAKFTNGPDSMPMVVLEIWQQVWTSTPADLGGERAYRTDFEVYDARAIDRENTTVDVYVGINALQ
jgi:predicted transcriptional regulator YdeE